MIPEYLENSFAGSGRSLDSYRTLVLNADYRPLSTAPLSTLSWSEAVKVVYRGTMQVIEEWEGPRVRSQKFSMPVPKVVICNTYVKAERNKAPTLSRINCALRDGFRCGYCGKGFVLRELTFDHVIPRSKGGVTSWENILMSCGPCNFAKGNETANYNGIRGEVRRGNFVPLSRPHQPTFGELYKAGLRFIPPEIRDIFSDYLPSAGATRANEMSDLTTKDGSPWDSETYWTVELER